MTGDEMKGNFTEKWNEGGKLLNAIFFSTPSLYFYKSVYNLISRSGQVDHLARKRFSFHKRNFFKPFSILTKKIILLIMQRSYFKRCNFVTTLNWNGCSWIEMVGHKEWSEKLKKSNLIFSRTFQTELPMVPLICTIRQLEIKLNHSIRCETPSSKFNTHSLALSLSHFFPLSFSFWMLWYS